MTDLQLFLLGFVVAQLLAGAVLWLSMAYATRDDFNGECE